MRRRQLLAALAAGVTAGCIGPLNSESDRGPDDREGGTEPDPSDDREGGDDGTEPDPSEDDGAGTDPGESDPPGDEMLVFGEAVTPEIRRRTVRALERTRALLGETLDAPVTVVLVQPEARTRNGRSILDRITHRDTPDLLPPPLGRYDAGNRRLALSDPAALPALAEQFRTQFGDTDPPDEPFSTYPDDPHLAHELTHAFQHDNPLDGVGSPDFSHRDGIFARAAVLEGAADYVAGRYAADCRDSTFESCVRPALALDTGETPRWAVREQLPYVNGTWLVHELHERGGWDAVWAAHEDPPETSWAAMFPERYLDDGIDIAEPFFEQPGESWQTGIDDRSGVNVLYEKLLHLGVVSTDDPDGAVPERVTDATALEQVFRSDLLADWRGDRFAYYTDGQDRDGYRWAVRFATASAAETMAATVAEGYDEHGTPADDHWQLDGDSVGIDRDGATVTFSMGAEKAALATIRPS